MTRVSFFSLKFIVFSMLGFVISSCAPIGSKTIYRSNILHAYELKTIGLSQPASEDKLNRIRMNASDLYRQTVEEFFSERSIKVKRYNLNSLELDFEVDSSEVRRLCAEKKLDGYLCARITFLKYDEARDLYSYTLSLDVNEIARADLKLFDSDGELIIHTMADTRSRYYLPPKADVTMKKALRGALKRMMSELDKS